jgi:hypothetical protein
VFPVRYELNLYMLYRRKKAASVVKWSEFLATKRRCIVLPVRYELNCLDSVGSSSSHNPVCLHSLLQGYFTFYFTYIIVIIIIIIVVLTL